MRNADRVLSMTVVLGCAAALVAPGTALAASSGTAVAAAPRLVVAMVADLLPGAPGSDPQDLTAMNGTLFFTARAGAHGRQLWKSDGTAAGTVMLTNVTGPLGADPEGLTAADGELFFSAWDPRRGRELWKSDGTAGGTTLVSDIVPGPLGASPEDITYAVGQQFEPAQQVLVYFSGWDARHGRQLWKSDGTAAGTVMVTDVGPGPAAGLRPTGITTNSYTEAAFSGDDGVHGREPWYSGGTAANTHMIADLNPGPAGSDPHNFAATILNQGILSVLTYFYFTANDGAHGSEMFVRWDSPSLALYDLNPGPESSDPSPFTEVVNGGGLIAANDGTHGRELFEPGVLLPFQPPDTGAKLAADINPGPASSNPVLAPDLALIGYQEFADIPESTTRTYMSADDGTHGRELWEADEVITRGFGESSGLGFDMSGVRPVADIARGGRGSSPQDFVPAGGRPPFGAATGDTEVFTANDGVHGRELWVSGGWNTNTAMAADINPGPAGSGPADITAIGQTAYFSADDGAHGRELWRVTLPPAPLTEVGLEGGNVTTGTQAVFYVGILAVPGMAQPSGDVTFYQDGTPLATVPLTSGFAGIMSATISVTASAGSHQIVGVYSGDGSYPSTTSSTMAYTGS